MREFADKSRRRLHYPNEPHVITATSPEMMRPPRTQRPTYEELEAENARLRESNAAKDARLEAAEGMLAIAGESAKKMDEANARLREQINRASADRAFILAAFAEAAPEEAHEAKMASFRRVNGLNNPQTEH